MVYRFFEQKAIHDFDAFFNAESIDCFVSSKLAFQQFNNARNDIVEVK